MLQTYGAVVKGCSLSCEGGMMIEYMSTVILTGWGPEACVTSNTTKQGLRHQAQEDGKGVGGRAEKERQAEGSARRELFLKAFKLLL